MEFVLNKFLILVCCLFVNFVAFGTDDYIQEFETRSTKFNIPGKAVFLENRDRPTIFWCHGGPHDPTDEDFLKSLSKLTQSNVIGFDFQGSIVTGYNTVAKDPQAGFYTSVDNDYGGGHMEDLKSVVAYATDNFSLNREKYVVAGHSFGGYMAALAVTDPVFSLTFKLGVLCSGFYDLGDYKTYNCPGNEENEEIKRRRSPLSYTHNILQPIILVHGGENDKTTLVNLENANIFFKNAKNEGKQITNIFMEDEKHDYSLEGWCKVGTKLAEQLKCLG